jgi:hypothetical protein
LNSTLVRVLLSRSEYVDLIVEQIRGEEEQARQALREWMGGHAEFDAPMLRPRHVEGKAGQVGAGGLGDDFIVEPFVKPGQLDSEPVPDRIGRPDIDPEIGLGLKVRVVARQAGWSGE